MYHNSSSMLHCSSQENIRRQSEFPCPRDVSYTLLLSCHSGCLKVGFTLPEQKMSKQAIGKQGDGWCEKTLSEVLRLQYPGKNESVPDSYQRRTQANLGCLRCYFGFAYRKNSQHDFQLYAPKKIWQNLKNTE